MEMVIRRVNKFDAPKSEKRPKFIGGWRVSEEIVGQSNLVMVDGYDEFGMETVEGNSARGLMQPFMYTGYQRDNIANTYYAQAREYTSNVGRFTGEDIIKGNGAYPFTLNQYAYCWSSPMGMVDLDGNAPIEPPNVQTGLGIESANIPNPQVELEGITNITNEKTVSLGKGWYYRFDKESHPHIHLHKGNMSQSYSQNTDGTNHHPPKADLDHRKVFKKIRKENGVELGAKG